MCGHVVTDCRNFEWMREFYACSIIVEIYNFQFTEILVFLMSAHMYIQDFGYFYWNQKAGNVIQME